MDYQEILQSEIFAAYYHLLNEWNQKFNLTSVILKEEVYLKHFYDSVLPLELIRDATKILDIGSGAGFPAIPLKITEERLDITMVESVNKKVTFLNEVINQLGLNNIRANHIRIEDFKIRDFDVVTARAVAPLNILCEYALPFLKTGGIFLAYKGINADEEVKSSQNALKVLGGIVDKIVYKNLSGDILRSFILIKKIKTTPQNYPRKGNKPRIQPL